VLEIFLQKVNVAQSYTERFQTDSAHLKCDYLSLKQFSPLYKGPEMFFAIVEFLINVGQQHTSYIGRRKMLHVESRDGASSVMERHHVDIDGISR
jgi:hypothetical protein